MSKKWDFTPRMKMENKEVTGKMKPPVTSYSRSNVFSIQLTQQWHIQVM